MLTSHFIILGKLTVLRLAFVFARFRYKIAHTHTNKASGQTSGSKSEWKLKL
jgi:hypothetical protein